jgi:hypothetical protein
VYSTESKLDVLNMKDSLRTSIRLELRSFWAVCVVAVLLILLQVGPCSCVLMGQAVLQQSHCLGAVCGPIAELHACRVGLHVVHCEP